MPFTRRDTWTFLCHYLLGWKRRIASESPNHYIEKPRANGMVLHPVRLPSGDPLICQICGYAIVEFEVADGWNFHLCSAHSLDKVLKDKGFKSWAAQLTPTKEKRQDASPLMQIKS